MRTEAERRHHRERVIENRLDIIRNIYEQPELEARGRGRFDKDHLTNCSCFCCKPHKHLPKTRGKGWLKFEEKAEGYYPLS